jgi:Na+/H+ antiporter NhaD/arsenite permease-like protein
VNALLAAGGDALVKPPWWSILPFAGILLAIAVLPLLRATAGWWHYNRNRLLIAVLFAALTLGYYLLRHDGFHGAAPGFASVAAVLDHAVLREYVPFITLLFSLYVIAGGISVQGDIQARPRSNTAILAIGGLLASLIGTTGASMVLIRLLLKTNSERRRVVHTVVFFIFIVSNVGGSLLPIGDPPLFLGYLRGVPFFWTLSLWLPWLVITAILLTVYFVWDTWAYRHETGAALQADRTTFQRIEIHGWINVLWLVLVVLAVATLDPSKPLPFTDWRPPPHLREGVQLALVALSLWTTPGGVRATNEFNYHAIVEVAALFIGIFITMQAPIELLHALAPEMGRSGFVHPWQYFWASGLLSSFLDNAPTYVVFFETANQLTHAPGPGIIKLVTGEYIRTDLLAAISCGAVFMGANTYIGNGPNFMVKAIAEHSGVKMPSFFGYMVYSTAVLLPIFVALTALFFL